MRTLGIDLETFAVVDIKKAGLYRYAENSEILLFAYAFDDEPVRVVDFTQGEALPDEVLKALWDKDIRKTAYNASFEIHVINHWLDTEGYIDMGESYLDPGQWWCTMVQGYTLGLPGGLEKVGKALSIAEDKQKLATGKRLIQYFCKPCKRTQANGGRTRNLPEHDPEKWELFKEYCRQDVEAERAIRKRMGPFNATSAERALWCLDQEINERGVLVDWQLVRNAIYIDDAVKADIMDKARELTGIENPNSNQQVLDWFEKEEGWRPKSLDKVARNDLQDKATSDRSKKLLQYKDLLGKTSVKKYIAMQEARCEDGKVRGMLQFYGASRTGRWAGRLVQLHNLPRNSMADLDEARSLVREGDYEGLSMLYDNPSDVLSQLIRTAFIAPEGKRFIVADFSAIEARVIAWIAGEQWVLDAFAEGKDIYCATASQMFRMPVVKHGINGELRAKGKIATLACGYGGGVTALTAFGADKMGLSEADMDSIVKKWRKANPHIVGMWADLEECVKRAIRTREVVKYRKGITLSVRHGFLFMQLPSGRSIAYANPLIEREERFNRDSLTYEGITVNGSWGKNYTWGGKLTENCIAKGTLVITQEGFLPIEQISKQTKVWDGQEWVSHEGLVDKGEQPVIAVNGLYMTADHRILTTEGWRESGCSEGFNWAEVSLPDSYPESRKYETRKGSMAVPVRLWNDDCSTEERPVKKGLSQEVMRVHEVEADIRSSQNSWDDKAPGMGSMAFNETEMYGAHTSGMEELRWPRNHGMPGVDGQLREILGGYGTDVSEGPGIGQDRQQQRLQQGELSLDNPEKELPKQKGMPNRGFSSWADDSCRTGRKDRNRCYNSDISFGSQLADKVSIGETRCQKQVYDLLDCGPRHRFAVWDSVAGKARLVHNCVQATARDCLGIAMLRLSEAGYKIVMHVHDEVIIEAPEGIGSLKEVCEIMGRPIPWAEGLLLTADGYETKYYKKD